MESLNNLLMNESYLMLYNPKMHKCIVLRWNIYRTVIIDYLFIGDFFPFDWEFIGKNVMFDKKTHSNFTPQQKLAMSNDLI